MRNIFDVEKALFSKVSSGSTHPEEVENIIRNHQWESIKTFNRFVVILGKVRDAQRNLDAWLPERETVPYEK